MIGILDLSDNPDVFVHDKYESYVSEIMLAALDFHTNVADGVNIKQGSSIREQILSYWNTKDYGACDDIRGQLMCYCNDGVTVLFVDARMRYVLTQVFIQKPSNPFYMTDPELIIEMHKMRML